MYTSLAKVLKWEKEPVELQLNICDLVHAACKTIVPLGPINTFAARNPWVGLEEQTFEQVARRFK
ncbi:MAG: putative inorganic carbon transporter subunit DabA, partial [Bacillus sp. (in: firmicutes)]